MSKDTNGYYLIYICLFLFIICCSVLMKSAFYSKRTRLLKRLRQTYVYQNFDGDDILAQPLYKRTVGAFASWLVVKISKLTPKQSMLSISKKLEKAGSPFGIKPGDFIAAQIILGLTVLVVSWFLLRMLNIKASNSIFFALILTALAIYIPWFLLARSATRRQGDIKRKLPDIMDLLVVSVEAGLAFDMALSKVVEKFPGIVALEFQRALREIQLGKQRKDAFKSMTKRVDLEELSALINAVIQSDQLGVGLGNVLRMQADLIREKRQQWVEEQAMKAPIKMLFPLVMFILPSIFIVILGPAVLSIMKTFAEK